MGKRIKELTKKQKIIGLAVILGILVITFTIIIGITILKQKSKTQLTSNQLNNSLEIPNITDENTVFNISTLEEAENVIIKVDKKLEEYNLHYLIEKIVEIEEQTNEANTTADTIDKNDFSTYTLFENELNITENSNIYFIYEKNGNYSKEIYEIKITNIIKSLQTEEISEEEIEKNKVDKNSKTNKTAAYYIKVNYGANVVTIYGKDANGDYTVPVKAMVCSTGTSTPKGGVYKTSRGFVWGTLFGGVYGMYSTRIVGHILFHSVPYTAPRNDALEYWEYDKLGTKASMGCIRLTVADAKWIFNNCGTGTMVEFYSSADPGPLGKPSAPKISNNEQCRNWDPTDSIPGNPWFAEEEKITPEEVISGDTTNGEIITDDTILTD